MPDKEEVNMKFSVFVVSRRRGKKEEGGGGKSELFHIVANI